jgi:hypothetical protein
LSSKRSVEEILRQSEQRLQVARFGLQDMQNAPGRIRSGLANVASFGRAATFALQGLRSVVDDFDKWYGPQQEAMKNDPLMSYFKDLRNDIEKGGKPVPLETKWSTGTIRFPEDFGERPPGAIGFFLMDVEGAMGWEIKTPEGSVEKYYVKPPEHMVEVLTRLTGAPPLPDNPHPSATELAAAYLSRVDSLLREARQRFGE